MPRERSRTPSTKRRRSPTRSFRSHSRSRDEKHRRRSSSDRNDPRSKTSSVSKREEGLPRPNKGTTSNRFQGPNPRNPRPPARRSSQPLKKATIRRPSTNLKDSKKNQSSSLHRRKELPSGQGSRLDQKSKDSFFRDDNRGGKGFFKSSDEGPPDQYLRNTPPLHRALMEKEDRELYSDYRSSAYKEDIDERRRLNEEPFSNRNRTSITPERYRGPSPNREPPPRYNEDPVLRHDSPYADNMRDMERDNYASRAGKIAPTKSFKFDDVAKITVDIRRKVRDPSPGMRSPIDTSDIVIVRRPGEGIRPIFEREEIGTGMKHMDESSDYTERRVVAMIQSDHRSRSQTPERMNFPHSSLRENFEVQRDKFESSTLGSDPSTSLGKPTLSDRWQQFDERQRKLEGDRLSGHQVDNRDDFDMHIATEERYCRESYECTSSYSQNPRTYSDLPGSQSPPRERYQRYSESEHSPKGRHDRDKFSRISSNPNDLRHNLSRKRHGSLDTDLRPFDARLRILERKDGQKELDRHPAESSSESRRRGEERSHSSSRNRKLKEERLPDFPSRSDKYKYQDWMDKSEPSSKGSSYFEATKQREVRPSRMYTSYIKHDIRGESSFYSNRRGSMPWIRSRGRGRASFRSRGFFRGGFRGRGRGIGFVRRRGSGYRDGGSPRQWKHDLFDRGSDEKPVSKRSTTVEKQKSKEIL